MIIELVGLAGAGKTHLACALRERRATIVAPRSRTALLFDAFLFELSHPLLAFRLAATVLLRAPSSMRYSLYVNAYLGSAAKWTEARRLDRAGKIAVIDQGFAHLVVALLGIPNTLLRDLPKPDRLVLVETSSALRQERMTERNRMPRIEQGSESAQIWDRKAQDALNSALPAFERAYPSFIRVEGDAKPELNLDLIFASAHQRPPRASFGKRFLLAFSSFFSFLLPRRGAAVLMYHAVDESGWRLAIPPRDFDVQMRYLKEHSTVVPLTEVVAYAKGEKELPNNAVSVTFDDGFHDLVSTVLPILTKYQLPVTLFLTTNLTERTNSFGTPRLSEDDLAILIKSDLVTIESHGSTHPHLPQLSPQVVAAEIEDAKKSLHAHGVDAHYFAYPFGDRAPFVETAVSAHHEAAFSITEGFVQKGSDLMHLPRIQVDTTMTPAMFRARLTSALTINRALVNLFRS